MEKEILNEFLGESGDLAITINNLNDLTTYLNTVTPSNTWPMSTLLHVVRALNALNALSAIMDANDGS